MNEMIEPRKTGAFISKLRRERDWTQLQLAERLSVTHQAVSRWETGDAFPDIGMLPVLAQTFGVTVDDLLNGVVSTTSNALLPVTAGHVINELAQGHMDSVAQMVKNDPEGFNAVLEAAPLTPPSMIKGVIEKMEGFPFKNDQIEELAPFLDKDVLLELLMARGGGLDGELLTSLAPFLGEEELDHIVNQMMDGTVSMEHLAGLAPFLNRETLDRLVQSVSEEGPFKPEHVVELAPFLSKETLSGLVDQFEEGKIEFDLVVELAPFIEKSRLDDLVMKNAGEKISGDQVSELAPFVSKDLLQNLVGRVLEGTLSNDLLSTLAPFLDREMLNALVRERIKRKEATPSAPDGSQELM
jgi:transcriptional regulator with XRE-family HTH domain